MKNEKGISTNRLLNYSIWCKGTTLVIVFVLLLVNGCSLNTPQTPTGTEVHENQEEPTSTLTATKNVLPTITPTNTPSPTLLSVASVVPTNSDGASVVPTVFQGDGQYIYKNARITFIDTDLHSPLHMNFDDLNDYEKKKRDIEIIIATGTAGRSIEVLPINDAKLYFSDNKVMDYDSCFSEFSIHAEETPQSPPGEIRLGSGDSYCILTNEGHIAVFFLVNVPLKPNDQGNLDMTFNITVYKKVAVEVFTPAPTNTPGPSPTPTNKYSIAGVTDEQVIVIDNAILSFIQAIQKNDREIVSQMISYPLCVYYYKGDRYLTINDKKDLLENFEAIFTPVFVNEISNATLEHDAWVKPEGVYLFLNSGDILFSKQGKIISIENADLANT